MISPRRIARRCLVAIGVIVVAVLSSCGSSTSGPDAGDCSYDVSIDPNAVTLAPGEETQFRGSMTRVCDGSTYIDGNRAAFDAQILEQDGGTLEAERDNSVYWTYTAPAGPGQYTLRITCAEHPASTAEAVITVE